MPPKYLLPGIPGVKKKVKYQDVEGEHHVTEVWDDRQQSKNAKAKLVTRETVLPHPRGKQKRVTAELAAMCRKQRCSRRVPAIAAAPELLRFI